LPALARAKGKAHTIECLNKLRQIGVATMLFADDHEGKLPRSTHSALGHGEQPWGYALSAYLTSKPYVAPDANWTNLFYGLYRCPQHRRHTAEWSYGKNVYPELSALETGGPTWPRIEVMPRPVLTVLFAEKLGGSMADHLMAHFWEEGATPEVDQRRHGRVSNYIYCDGHAVSQRFEQTFNLQRKINNWNPETAQ
jgi:prepilin-type processing-associated H-X9-DG protein